MNFYRPPTTQGTLDALGAVYRAIRALRFYPDSHPARRTMLELAHTTMLQLLDGNTLMLTCGSSGFSFPDGEFLKDSSGLSATFSFDLFVRRVSKITFCPDLFSEDLLEFCRLISIHPDAVKKAGGFDTLLADHGVRSIWVNEFDLQAISRKRRQMELAGIPPHGFDDTGTGVTAVEPVSLSALDNQPLDQQLQILLGKLSVCFDDDSYLLLIRQAVACAEALLHQQQIRPLLPLAELLAVHVNDRNRSSAMLDFARFALEQLAVNDRFLNLALENAGTGVTLSSSAIEEIIKAGGDSAIRAAIEQMARTSNVKSRKLLSTALGKLGEPAVSTLLELLTDSRWFITRNICAILGAIASNRALPALLECLKHSDLRVRKEAARSLAQLGSSPAENALLDILRSDDHALHPQAIASLGGMKSRAALVELLKIVGNRDTFLKTLTLKVDALAAIAMIGDRQVTPLLLRVLAERHLLAAKRGQQLKIAVANCLGKLGDSRALHDLRRLATERGPVGNACAEALALIHKLEGIPDDGRI